MNDKIALKGFCVTLGQIGPARQHDVSHWADRPPFDPMRDAPGKSPLAGREHQLLGPPDIAPDRPQRRLEAQNAVGAVMRADIRS
jgi:hypothetical protein